MADIITEIGSIIIGIFEGFINNLFGVILTIGVLVLIYIAYVKPKPQDMGKILFQKYWEVTAEQCKLKESKKLALVPLTHSIEELKKPINQLYFQPIGDIIGINTLSTVVSFEDLQSFNNKPSDETLNKLRVEHKTIEDPLWLVFAYKKKLGGGFFSKSKKALIFVKEYQIITLNSSDNNIYIRGFGITPVGEYEVINDEIIAYNRMQQFKGITNIMTEEIALSTFAGMGHIVEKSITMDAEFRKLTGLLNVDVLKNVKGDTQEVKNN